MWKHVVALSKMPSETVLQNVPELRPLFLLLDPMAANQPVSNGGQNAESIMKTIGKVCNPQMRMNDKTASRNVCAVRRDSILEVLNLRARAAAGVLSVVSASPAVSSLRRSASDTAPSRRCSRPLGMSEWPCTLPPRRPPSGIPASVRCLCNRTPVRRPPPRGKPASERKTFSRTLVRRPSPHGTPASAR